jgi:hypothetical protein
MKAGNSQQYRAKAMRHSEILQSYLVAASLLPMEDLRWKKQISLL